MDASPSLAERIETFLRQEEGMTSRQRIERRVKLADACVRAHQSDIRIQFHIAFSAFSREERAHLVEHVQQFGNGIGPRFDSLLRILGIDRTTYLEWIREMENAPGDSGAKPPRLRQADMEQNAPSASLSGQPHNNEKRSA